MERKSQRSLFKTNPKKKKGAALIKETLMQLFQTQFGGDTDSFLKAFSGIFVAKGKEEFDGTVPMKELSSMLSSRTIKRAKTETNLLDTLVSQTAPQVYKLSALESIYYADNLSGRRLTERYRQRLPGVFPSARAERLTKRNLKDIFSYVLLPRRTPSGWKLDLSRLIEVLGFQYYLLDSEVKHWKIHGDGREIAKRHSTFISLNILNNDAVLHGVNFQSPDHVYPFQVFYDSDSRDNIEVNMGYGLLDSLTTGNTFYLGGDEMFLESILDGSSILSPTSDEGWNIYSKCTKKSRSDTGTDGLRTSLGKTIDRGHPESFFGDAIPTNRIVFCLLHATARSVEKLLALEVANVLSEANKQNEKTAGQGDAYRQTAIGNLETNISRRGVRNGNFKLEFNKSGSPEPISLNKDNALLILHPDDESFPHPLKGVLPARSVTVNLPTSIRNKLGIPEKYSEFELVKTMWNCLWKMLKILRKDDMPATGSQLTKEQLQSHTWGYSEEDRDDYILAAELFYQLFSLRHGATTLTPYMIKLIDHAPQLMSELPFPFARFQSEGAEHLNYYDSKFYHRKTTRHGGKDRLDPVLASFHHRWTNLYYNIHSYTLAEDERKASAGQQFLEHCLKHRSAGVIQKVFRGYVVRRRFQALGWISYMSADHNVKTAILQTFATQQTTQCDTDNPLKGQNFVLSGNLSSTAGKSLTHATMRKMITDNGGCVKDTVPYRSKTVSAKKYIVVSSLKSVQNRKQAAVVHHAVRRGFPVVSSQYVLDTVEKKRRGCTSPYELDITHLTSKITKDISVGRRHFSRKRTLKSLLKQRKKEERPTQKMLNKTSKYLNPCVFYVAQKLRQSQTGSQKEQRKLFAKYTLDWRALSLEQKREVSEAWRQYKQTT